MLRLLLAAFLVIPAAQARAHQPAFAPLPPHWTPERPHETTTTVQARLTGIYGHGLEGLVRTHFDDESALCTGDVAAQEAFSARVGPHQTEFWVYMTRDQGVLFSRTVHINPAQPCSEAPSYSLKVERALRVDGVIHSFEHADEGYDLEQLFSRRADHDDGEYAGSFNFLSNLMARGEGERGPRIMREVIAGHPARCAVSGGIVWHRICRSQAAGQARGMLVLTEAGDDTAILFSMRFDRLESNVGLDPRLFDLRWRWADRR